MREYGTAKISLSIDVVALVDACVHRCPATRDEPAEWEISDWGVADVEVEGQPVFTDEDDVRDALYKAYNKALVGAVNKLGPNDLEG